MGEENGKWNPGSFYIFLVSGLVFFLFKKCRSIVELLHGILTLGTWNDSLTLNWRLVNLAMGKGELTSVESQDLFQSGMFMCAKALNSILMADHLTAVRWTMLIWGTLSMCLRDWIISKMPFCFCFWDTFLSWFGVAQFSLQLFFFICGTWGLGARRQRGVVDDPRWYWWASHGREKLDNNC